MTSVQRLCSLAGIAPGVGLPAYMPEAHGAGIVHLGAGAFMRAHLAAYTDAALAASGGDWRILGVSLRGTDVADALNPQNGLYTLLECGAQGTSARIIGSIACIIASSLAPGAALAAMAAPQTRIVSLTVTEKAYGIDRQAEGVDVTHPAVSADLANPRMPSGVLGLIVESLRLRQAAGHLPFTVLCCDNLPDNGSLLRFGVVDFARRIDSGLGDWIAGHVAFPSTMVDRITPSPTDAVRDNARRLTGFADLAAVETEPFSQWVVEDRFSNGRPHWEAGGALFVDKVAPFEAMKLRMLNGTHSMLAYAGHLAGCKYVRDVMAQDSLAPLIARHLRAAAATLAPIDNVDFDDYAEALKQRFANPAIAHQTYQIAMDGTEKLPQRILQPAVEALNAGQDIRPFAFAVACWMRYCLGRLDNGTKYALRDPREAQISSAIAGASDAQAIVDALHSLPGLFPASLTASSVWRGALCEILADMLARGIDAAIDAEAGAAYRA